MIWNNKTSWKYVDHVTISEFLSINEPSTLQSNLDAIQLWATQNDMRLDGMKYNEMISSFLQNQPDISRL